MDFPTVTLFVSRERKAPSVDLTLAAVLGWTLAPDGNVALFLRDGDEIDWSGTRADLERLLADRTPVGFQLWSSVEDGSDLFVTVKDGATLSFAMDGLRGDTLLSALAVALGHVVARALSGDLRFASVEFGPRGSYPPVWREDRLDWSTTESLPDLVVLPAGDVSDAPIPDEMSRLELGPYIALVHEQLAPHLVWRRDRS